MPIEPIDPLELARRLALPDLSQRVEGDPPHAIAQVADLLEEAAAVAWPEAVVRRDPGPRVVDVADNYDALRYRPDDVTRDRRYTRYVGGGRMLRSHTSARIPVLLRELAAQARTGSAAAEVLLSVPGLCYRRDVVDRQHVGEPHQHDLWLVRLDGPLLGESDLVRLVSAVTGSVLPGRAVTTPPSPHPYTLAGREVRVGGVEVGECGLAHPEVLASAGLPGSASGLAMGLGLDRITMLVKGIDDIRLLRSVDPRVVAQLHDLAPWRRVSAMPPAWRDLSLAVGPGDEVLDDDLLGDRVRDALGPDASGVEEVSALARTPYEQVPPAARERMGMRPGQVNLLLRVVVRDLERTLTGPELDALRDRVYAALHQGDRHEWALHHDAGR
ncbi:MAG: PheS-related mystery ligase SrmL [Motilibacteraceae bacterium]